MVLAKISGQNLRISKNSTPQTDKLPGLRIAAPRKYSARTTRREASSAAISQVAAGRGDIPVAHVIGARSAQNLPQVTSDVHEVLARA